MQAGFGDEVVAYGHDQQAGSRSRGVSCQRGFYGAQRIGKGGSEVLGSVNWQSKVVQAGRLLELLSILCGHGRNPVPGLGINKLPASNAVPGILQERGYQHNCKGRNPRAPGVCSSRKSVPVLLSRAAT